MPLDYEFGGALGSEIERQRVQREERRRQGLPTPDRPAATNRRPAARGLPFGIGGPQDPSLGGAILRQPGKGRAQKTAEIVMSALGEGASMLLGGGGRGSPSGRFHAARERAIEKAFDREKRMMEFSKLFQDAYSMLAGLPEGAERDAVRIALQGQFMELGMEREAAILSADPFSIDDAFHVATIEYIFGEDSPEAMFVRAGMEPTKENLAGAHLRKDQDNFARFRKLAPQIMREVGEMDAKTRKQCMGDGTNMTSSDLQCLVDHLSVELQREINRNGMLSSMLTETGQKILQATPGFTSISFVDEQKRAGLKRFAEAKPSTTFKRVFDTLTGDRLGDFRADAKELDEFEGNPRYRIENISARVSEAEAPAGFDDKPEARRAREVVGASRRIKTNIAFAEALVREHGQAVIGVPGAVRSLSQDIVQQIRGTFDDRTNMALEFPEMFADDFDFEGNFDPTMDELEMLSTSIAFDFAAIIFNQQGRAVTEAEFQRFKNQTGLVGLRNSPPRAISLLDQMARLVDQRATSALTILEGELEPVEVDPSGFSPSQLEIMLKHDQLSVDRLSVNQLLDMVHRGVITQQEAEESALRRGLLRESGTEIEE